MERLAWSTKLAPGKPKQHSKSLLALHPCQRGVREVPEGDRCGGGKQ